MLLFPSENVALQQERTINLYCDTVLDKSHREGYSLNSKFDMVDSVYRTRSLGIGVSGIPDQYADGKAARVWQHYIGGHKKRTESYREFFCNLLRENDVKHILDVACGTG